MIRDRSWHVGELMLAIALLAPVLAFSQQPPESTSTQDRDSANPPTQSSTSGTESGASQSQPNPAVGTGLLARALNSASPLVAENGPLRWGWVSVRSASFLQFFTNQTLDNPGTRPESQDLTASQLSTAIVLNHAFGSARLTQLTVQYTPSLFITQGNVYTNALNQSAGLDTTFHLSPRWGLQVSDRFSYFGNLRTFSGLSLDANYSLGTVSQNSFLNGPGTLINNTLGISFTYLWSPVTTVSFTPGFGYQNASGAVDSGQNLSSLYWSGQLIVSHSLSATQTVGISYTGQYASYTNTSSTAGPQSNGWMQDFLVTYGKKFGASWRLTLGLGVTNNTGNSGQTSLAVNAGITKSFQRMDFVLGYDRGHQFNGYITSDATDRTNLVHTIRWSRRFTTSTSGAYFRTASSPRPGTSGIYATELLSFGLTRSLSLNGGFSYTKQTGDDVYVQSGHRRFVTVGIAWATPTPAQY